MTAARIWLGPRDDRSVVVVAEVREIPAQPLVVGIVQRVEEYQQLDRRFCGDLPDRER